MVAARAAMIWVVTREPFTVNAKVLSDVAPKASVAVTVNTVVASIAVGVPLSSPEAAANGNS